MALSFSTLCFSFPITPLAAPGPLSTNFADLDGLLQPSHVLFKGKLVHSHCRTSIGCACSCSGNGHSNGKQPCVVLCWKQFDLNCQVGMRFGSPGFPFSVPLSHGAVRGSLFSSARAGGQDQSLRIIVRAAMSWAVLFSYLRHS